MFRDVRTYRIIGAAMAVHRKLGHRFLEAVNQQALARQFEVEGIPYQREVPFKIEFEGRTLDASYRADFVCFGDVLVEVKAQAALGRPETAQVLNYLRASNLEIGLLLNFGTTSLEKRRFIFSRSYATTQSAKFRGMEDASAWDSSTTMPSADSAKSVAPN